VAPFPGMIYKGNNSNEVIIECDTAALKDITIVITNVKVQVQTFGNISLSGNFSKIRGHKNVSDHPR
jgi:predicted RNase H-related nuclease YkuK (DUF458 family)